MACTAVEEFTAWIKNELHSLLQKESEVEKSQTNFMVLVQSLLKNPTERKRFFQVCINI